jgi:hypothetical protein
MQQCIKIFISYLYGAQHVSGDTPPIIRSLKLHLQPLVLHMWRVARRVVVSPHVLLNQMAAFILHSFRLMFLVQQPSTYIKTVAASVVLGS